MLTINLKVSSQEMIPVMTDLISKPELVPFRKGDKWGYADPAGNMKIPTTFSFVELFCGKLGYVCLPDSMGDAVIDLSGKILVSFPKGFGFSITDTTALIYTNNGVSKFMVNQRGIKTDMSQYEEVNYYGRYGIGKTANHELVYPNNANGTQIDSVINANTHYYLLEGSGKAMREIPSDSVKEFGVFDPNKNLITSTYKVSQLKNGWTFYKENSDVIYRDRNGNTYTLLYTYEDRDGYRYTVYDPFKNGVALLVKDGKQGLVDSAGNILVPFGKYFNINRFSDGMAQVQVKEDSDEIIFIDTKGNEFKAKPNYGFNDEFYGGYARIYLYKGKFTDGFINKAGKTFFLKKYYGSIERFSEGLCLVRNEDGKAGFIDSTGKEVIPTTLEYDEIDVFKDGLCRVKKNGLYGFIDRTGKEVIAVTLAEAKPFEHGFSELLIKPCDNCFINIINKAGEKLPYLFNGGDEWQNGYRVCYYDDGNKYDYKKKQGVAGQGKLIVPIEYDFVSVFPNGYAKASIMAESDIFQYIFLGYINLKTSIKYFSE